MLPRRIPEIFTCKGEKMKLFKLLILCGLVWAGYSVYSGEIDLGGCSSENAFMKAECFEITE